MTIFCRENLFSLILGEINIFKLIPSTHTSVLFIIVIRIVWNRTYGDGELEGITEDKH